MNKAQWAGCVLGAAAGLGLGLMVSLKKVLIALLSLQTVLVFCLTVVSVSHKAGLFVTVPGAGLVLNLVCLLGLLRPTMKGQPGEKWLSRGLLLTAIIIFLSAPSLIFHKRMVSLSIALSVSGMIALPSALIAAAFWIQRPAALAAGQAEPAPVEESPSLTPSGSGEDAEK